MRCACDNTFCVYGNFGISSRRYAAICKHEDVFDVAATVKRFRVCDDRSRKLNRPCGLKFNCLVGECCFVDFSLRVQKSDPRCRRCGFCKKDISLRTRRVNPKRANVVADVARGGGGAFDFDVSAESVFQRVVCGSAVADLKFASVGFDAKFTERQNGVFTRPICRRVVAHNQRYIECLVCHF